MITYDTELQAYAITDAEKHGYHIACTDGMLEIQRIEKLNRFASNAAAAKQAYRDGIRIIPPDQLPAGFPYRRYGWIDTPSNRVIITEFTKHYEPKLDNNAARQTINQNGILVDSRLCAYLNRYDDLHRVFADEAGHILTRLDEAYHQMFAQAVAHHDWALDAAGYFDISLAVDILTRNQIPVKILPHFIGDIVRASSPHINLHPTGQLGIIPLDDDDFLACVDRTQEIIAHIVPNDFPFREHTVHLSGTYLNLD